MKFTKYNNPNKRRARKRLSMTIDEIQAELQQEIDLCNKYFKEEEIHKESTAHERLALKIVMMCMQTLSSLKDGELEDYKHIKQWKSDVMDVFCRYDCNSVEEAIHNGYIKGIQECLSILYFYKDNWDGIYQAIESIEELKRGEE